MDTVIKTERLTVRPIGTDDVVTAHGYASDLNITKYMLFLPNESISQTREFLRNAENEWRKESPSFFEFAIVLDNAHIGAVSLYLDDGKTEGELGWILAERYQGKGYATEAAAAVKNFAVNTLKLSRLVAHCDTRNTASARVMEKLGLKLEGTGKRTYRNGECAEEYCYSLDI